MHPRAEQALTKDLLDLLVSHCARPPRPVMGGVNPGGHGRIVARARAFVLENLEHPLSVDAMAAAAFTSHRTLHRAFNTVLDETPQAFVRKLRLHRIRHDLASPAEAACTVAVVANRWGIGELGRLAGWYRDLFGELPSETLAGRRPSLELAA
ncbi:MAG: helix-turn-helix domain-containing protein [Geminicoccaceae bacterium]